MRNERNAAVSLLKLFAACCVVLIHVRFPGTLGQWMDCLARFAVPFFFGISGYYAYRVDARRLVRRMKKLLVLGLVTYCVYLIWECYYRHAIAHTDVREYIAQLFGIKGIAGFVFMEKITLCGHLWYLSAMMVVYVLLALYSNFWSKTEDINYTPFYCVAACACLLYFAFGFKMAGAGLKTDKLMYRNGLFFGLPAFALGLFLNQHGKTIVERYRLNAGKSVAMILFGFALSLLQWFGIGRTSMPCGMLLTVTGIILLVMSGRQASTHSVAVQRLLRCAETSSTVVYLFHLLIHRMISKGGKGIPFLKALTAHKSLYPLAIVAASLALGVLVSLVKGMLAGKRAGE